MYGLRKIIQEGKREGKLEAILALMETTKWDADKAMDMLKIERDDRPTYAAFVKSAMTSDGVVVQA